MARRGFETVDDYLAAQPAPACKSLKRVRAILLKAMPGASEIISYQIPAYKIDGRMVLYFAGHKDHYAIYPATARLIEELGAEIKGRLHGKATIRFAYDEALPTRLITRIAKARAAEAADALKAKSRPVKKASARAKTTTSRAKKT